MTKLPEYIEIFKKLSFRNTDNLPNNCESRLDSLVAFSTKFDD